MAVKSATKCPEPPDCLDRNHQAALTSNPQARGTQVDALTQRLESTERALADAEASLQSNELVRRKLHNTVMELKGNIRVFCRARPTSAAEAAAAGKCVQSQENVSAPLPPPST